MRSAPRVVVARVVRSRLTVQQQALLEVLVGKVLVATEGVGVREVGVELERALEKLDGRFVLLLQREAVAHHAPGLRTEAVECQRILSQVANLYLH